MKPKVFSENIVMKKQFITLECKISCLIFFISKIIPRSK